MHKNKNARQLTRGIQILRCHGINHMWIDILVINWHIILDMGYKNDILGENVDVDWIHFPLKKHHITLQIQLEPQVKFLKRTRWLWLYIRQTSTCKSNLNFQTLNPRLINTGYCRMLSILSKFNIIFCNVSWKSDNLTWHILYDYCTVLVYNESVYITKFHPFIIISRDVQNLNSSSFWVAIERVHSEQHSNPKACWTKLIEKVIIDLSNTVLALFY